MDAFAVERFEASRDRLASIAYRLLGSATDAEDVVQDAFLRWHEADREYISVPEAWLTKIVMNLALDRLRSASARREHAVGTWMPEPLLEGDPMLGPADAVEQRESVTFGVLVLMERLTPMERCVYVLREAFGYRHSEIAEILEVTEAASQQHIHRARRRIALETKQTEVDRAAARRIVEAFVDAASSGRIERLVALLTDDATAVSDGAGLGLAMRPARHETPDRIARAVRAGFKASQAKRRLVGGSPSIYATVVNGWPAMLAVLDGRVLAVTILEPRGDKIASLRSIADRDRLDRLTHQWQRREHDDPLIGAW